MRVGDLVAPLVHRGSPMVLIRGPKGDSMTRSLESLEQTIRDGECAIERSCRDEYVNKLPIPRSQIFVVRLTHTFDVLSGAGE